MGKKPKDISAVFRRIALSMPEAAESSHMGHPDFRVPGVKGKIFATLLCSEPEVLDEDRGMVKLTPEQQSSFVAKAPQVFSPIKGAWGLQGCTQVDLTRRVSEKMLEEALRAAWSNAAPKRLVARYQ